MEVVVAVLLLGAAWFWLSHLVGKQKAEEEAVRDLLKRRNEVAARNDKKMELWYERNRKRRSWAHLTRLERRSAIEWGSQPYAELDPGISLHSLKTKLQSEGRQACYLCDLELNLFSDDIHLDHIVPITNGGTHTWDNVALVHATCNLSKGSSATTLRAGRKGPLPNRSAARLRREADIKTFFDEHRGQVGSDVAKEFARRFPDPDLPPLTRRPKLEERPRE
jgi:5-methylcytosine-specific restriction endonuclease McrA